MKSYLLLPVALLAGLVIGGIGPRSELTRLRAERDALKRIAAVSNRGGADVGGVTRLLGVSAADGSAERDASVSASDRTGITAGPRQEMVSDGLTNAVDSSPNAVDSRADAEPRTPDRQRPNRDAARNLDQAIELWQTRAAIAKSTFVSNVRLNHAQTVQLETTLAAMNLRIGSTIDAFAESIQGAEAVQPEAGIRLMHKITDSIVLAYDELDESMPREWRRQAGDRFSLTGFIDPEVARPIIGLEDKLQGWQ